MSDALLSPADDEERQFAFLGFSAVFGGGLIAYEAMRAIREGDFFKTEELTEKPTASLVAYGAGIAMTAAALNETAKSTGWKPLILGGLGLTTFAFIGRAMRNR
jgi:hypothetical protein